jgi:hypothetical protein
MIIVNLCKDIKHDYKKWWGQWKAMPTCINEYCKFANSLKFGSWKQMLARVGQSLITTINNEGWNLAMEEQNVPLISQCLCL